MSFLKKKTVFFYFVLTFAKTILLEKNLCFFLFFMLFHFNIVIFYKKQCIFVFVNLLNSGAIYWSFFGLKQEYSVIFILCAKCKHEKYCFYRSSKTSLFPVQSQNILKVYRIIFMYSNILSIIIRENDVCFKLFFMKNKGFKCRKLDFSIDNNMLVLIAEFLKKYLQNIKRKKKKQYSFD